MNTNYIMKIFFSAINSALHSSLGDMMIITSENIDNTKVSNISFNAHRTMDSKQSFEITYIRFFVKM